MTGGGPIYWSKEMTFKWSPEKRGTSWVKSDRKSILGRGNRICKICLENFSASCKNISETFLDSTPLQSMANDLSYYLHQPGQLSVLYLSLLVYKLLKDGTAS